MTDKELLGWAAKAAGHKYRHAQDQHWIRCSTGYQSWNPLTDDGDALRLAVKCKIDLILTHSDCESAFDHKCIQYAEPTTPDPCAATRRAIVRAAAEIGKEMP